MSSSSDFPPVTGQDILNCSFSSWYTKYHRLSPRARIIKPLPEEFLTFLKSDGIRIPGEYPRPQRKWLIGGKPLVYSLKLMKSMMTRKSMPKTTLLYSPRKSLALTVGGRPARRFYGPINKRNFRPEWLRSPQTKLVNAKGFTPQTIIVM
jgi:hypothetical protein